MVEFSLQRTYIMQRLQDSISFIPLFRIADANNMEGFLLLRPYHE